LTKSRRHDCLQQRKSLDYARLTKLGVLLGLGLFVVGAGGEFVGHAVWGTLPAWEETLLTDSVGLGIVVAFCSVFGFGIAMPLLE
jgi:hypothetical protein